MKKLRKSLSKILFTGLLLSLVLLVGSCENWMSNDDFMSKIESEVHDANAEHISVYVRYANAKMGETEPQGNTTMKVDVAQNISAITSDDYGFVKWAAFSSNDFPTNKQHSKLTFVTENDYNDNYKILELPSSVVEFSDVKNPNTSVKIKSNRNDIFIIPIVAIRPKYNQSVPANGDSNIVKNTSIRILFTKAIDPATLYDEDGNVNYSITTGAATLVDDDSDLESIDITDMFTPQLSSSGKMLTLQLKSKKDADGNVIGQELLENKQRITITLLESLCDLYGFSMNGNYTFSFVTGTNTDSLAPTIEVLWAGVGDVENIYVSFFDNEFDGRATDASKNASHDIDDEDYTDALLAQRVKDKFNIYVKAEDIIASAKKDIDPSKDLIESNVSFIGISASLYVDADGNPITVKTDENTIAKKNYVYIPGDYTSGAEENQIFAEKVNLSDSGTIITYDVSNLPDGLIKIDVWGIDNTGNSGGPDDKGAPYYNSTNQDNSFKSIFIVKDSTPIDSEKVKAEKKVISNSASAPYYWYNESTLNTMKLFDSLTNKIQDSGHPKLRALDKNLWWTFRVGAEKQNVKENDSTWQRIHDAETGNTSISYSLSNAKAPSKDGPVDITLYLKDDMGNMSEPVLLDSIMYDNTAPTVTLKAGIGDFVDAATGESVLHAYDDKVINQVLKVEIGEDNVDETGSGIRRFEVHITKDGNEVAVPLDAANFAVKYAPSSIENPKPNSTGIRNIEIDKDDIASTDNLKVFKVNDKTKITNGTLFIYGISLGETDGQYQIAIDLYDSALNKTAESAKTNFSLDTTDPVIKKVQIEGAKSRVAYGTDQKTWWLPLQNQDVATLEKVTFKVDVNETGSGIKYIKLGKNIKFTEAAKIKYLGNYLEQDKDYELNVEDRIIELKDWFTPIINSDNAAITLENVKLDNPDSIEGNEISITTEDFVTKTSGATTEFFYDATTSGSVIYTDTTKPEIKELIIHDAAEEKTNNPYSLGYDNTYTDSQNVTLLLTLGAESTKNGSGVKVIHLSDNAIFTDSTEIYVDDNTTPLSKGENGDYTISDDKKSVTFEKVFTEETRLTFENVNIISDVQGSQTVKAYLTDFVGLENAAYESEAVILDQHKPVITNIEWVAEEGVAKGSAKGNVITQEFKVDFKEDNSGARIIRLDIDYEKDPAGTLSYNKPFDFSEFELWYGDTKLTKGTDYEIKNERYILLKTPKIAENGTFIFKNLQLRDSPQEGEYYINVTLLDQAENINLQDDSAIFKKRVFIDTTNPSVSEVKVLGAEKRSVYQNDSDERKWWMPVSYFDADKNLNKVSFVIKVKEEGSGIKVIKLSDDVEFTTATELKVGEKSLVKGTDYILNTEENTITLKDYEEPKLRGTETIFTLENIKLKKINNILGNKVGFTVTDWVTNDGNNENKLFYPDGSEGTYVYADSENPEIAKLTVEDSLQNSANNGDKKSYDKSNYTDNELVILTLTLGDKETDGKGSGVKTVILSDDAVFSNPTDNTSPATRIYVDNSATPLVKGEDYSFAEDKKSVTFTKVFDGENVIRFTNVKILSASNTQGNKILKADVVDFVNLQSEVSAASNTIVFDNTNPAVDGINWVPDDETVTAGSANDKIVGNQNLKIDFTEETAGVKVLKMDILKDNNTVSYANPFEDSFKLIDKNGNELVKGTDYTIDENDGRYIVLTHPLNSSTLSFRGINLIDEKTDGIYSVNVTLLDAAENKIETVKSIVIDTVNPVITQPLYVPNHKRSVELSNTTIAYDGMWLDKRYIKENANGTSTAASEIPLYITFTEDNSGVKVIKFVDNEQLDNTVLFAAEDSSKGIKKTTLYIVSEDSEGHVTETEIPSSKYTIKPDTKEIIINNQDDALKGTNYKILVKNIGFTESNADKTSKVSKNKITLNVSDVAKNISGAKTTAEDCIYTDSIKPERPVSFIIKDRGASTGKVEAKEGYTDESIVNMEIELNASEKYGSGYHQLKLDGATFINEEGGSNNTTFKVYIKGSNNSETEITDADFEIDGAVLTFKKKNQNENTYAVIRQPVIIKINNVQLIDPPTNGSSKFVTLTAYDLTGWDSPTISSSIIVDTQKPELEKPVFAANYTSIQHYVPSVNVYPHANGESASGIEINDIPTFYTATTYKKDYFRVNGEVSETENSLNKNFVHGAVLGFRAKDNIKLYDYSKDKKFLFYVKDENFALDTAAKVLGATIIENPKCLASSTSGNSETSAALWFGIDCGNYSAIFADEAGNCSEVFHFAVVQDTTKPDKEIQNRVLLKRPDDSSNIYRNDDADVSSDINYQAWKFSSEETLKIRHKKYVTKKSNSNYQIILNLGSTYTSTNLITQIDGTSLEADTAKNKPAYSVDKYSELDPGATSSPLKEYAISTWYGSWPTDSTSTIAYTPVAPDLTKFPSGQSLNPTGNNDTYALMACNYFGGDKNFSSYWRAMDVNAKWYSYESGSENSTTGSNGNKIISRVDTSGNLIIDVPYTQSTAPISVFLRDGCGNMNFVVLGLEEKVSSNGIIQIAPSFEIDDSLGYATPDSGKINAKGEVTTPIIMQNPYMTYASSGAQKAWDGVGFKWNKQSGNGDKTDDGHGGETFGFMKDKVKYATYYNPNLDTSTKKEQFKLGLTLRYGSTSGTVTKRESVTFDTWGIANSTQIKAGKYSARALLYCKKENDIPTYSEIIKCLNDELEITDETKKTGQVTDWTYVRADKDSSELSILLDYPQPNYVNLDWDVNDSSTHEPVPYYIWYLFEDRVGNYEIAKVVNSKASGTSLNSKASSTSTIYDKWLYDGDAPTIAIRGTITSTNKSGTSPASITNTQTEVERLVAKNNGYVPYLKTGTSNVYVSASSSHKVRNTNWKNSNVGYGTTHHVEGASETNAVGYQNRTYLPFFDLEVSEITGIRAFCWATDSTPPALIKDNVLSEGNTQGDNINKKWYAGYKAGDLDANIGVNHPYTGDSTNAYFSFTSSTSSYKGVYSGTKINTVMPSELLSTSTARNLYLHVIDWTGNVATYPMGEGLKFINDITPPSYNGSSTVVKSESNQYYVFIDHSNNAVDLTVRIAGKGDGSDDPITGQKDMYVEIPSAYYTDAGADVAGYILNGNTDIHRVSEIAEHNGKLYIPYNTYKSWKDDADWTSSTGHCYFTLFDNVGNCSNDNHFKAYLDKTPPVISNVELVIKQESSTETQKANFCDEETGLGTNSGNYNFNAYREYSKTAEYHEKAGDIKTSELQEIYINKEHVAKFHVNLNKATADLYDVQINRWSENKTEPEKSKWETVTSLVKNSTEWKPASSPKVSSSTKKEKTATPYIEMGSSITNGYDSLTYDADGEIYQVLAVDLSGNTSARYFKLYLDETPPTFTEAPEIKITKGSINKDKDGIYRYTADSNNKMTIDFTLSDGTGIGSKISSDKINYSYRWGTSENFTDFGTASKTLSFDNTTTSVLQNLYVKDALGNVTTTTPKFKYVYGTGDDEVIDNIEKLQYYAGYTGAGYTGYSAKAAYKNKVESENNCKNTSDGGVLIKDSKLDKLTITFTKPEGVIGYISLADGETLPSSFDNKNDLENSFTYSLPLTTETQTVDKAKLPKDVTKKYYAVDYVGNTKEFSIKYTYVNDDAPKNITIINGNISDGLKALLSDEIKNNLSTIIPKKKNNYYKDGYIILRAELKKELSDTAKVFEPTDLSKDYTELHNPATPVSVELYKLSDYFGNKYADELNIKYDATGNTPSLTLYSLGKDDNNGEENDEDKRYYCYLAFKINNKVHDISLLAKVTCAENSSSPIYYLADTDVTWKYDNTAPTINSSELKDSNILKKGYQYEGDYEKVYDRNNNEGNDKVTIAYKKGMKIKIKKDKITDAGVGAKSYKFEMVNGSTKTYDGPHDLVDNGTDYYIFEIPDIKNIHTELNLILIDELGNESKDSKKYIIPSPEDNGDRYWMLNDILKNDDENAITVTPLKEYTAQKPYPFLIEPTPGSIIKTIKINLTDDKGVVRDKGIGTGDFEETENGIKVKYLRTEFVDYNTNKTLLDSGTNWTNNTNGWVNINGFTVKLRSFTQAWYPQTVVFTINEHMDDEKVVKAENYIPAFSLDLNKVTWGNATLVSGKEDEYEVKLTLQSGATKDNVSFELIKDSTDEALKNVTATLVTRNENEPNKLKFVIKGVPSTKDWNDHLISIKIKDNYNTSADAVSITKEVLKISSMKLGDNENDIKLSKATWVEGQDNYKVPIELGNEAPISKLTGITVTASGVDNVNVEYKEETTEGGLKKPYFELSQVPVTSSSWIPKTISISISGDTVKETITLDALTIDAKKLGDSDVELIPGTYVKGTSEYRVPITLNGTNPPPIERLVGQTFTASKACVYVELVTGEDRTPSLNADGKYELKVTLTEGVQISKDWEEQYITVKISGDKVSSGALAALQAIKIEAINADDIEVKQLVTENGEEVEKTLSWDSVEFDSERSKTFKIKVKTPGDIDYNKLTVSGAELLDSDGKVIADTTDKEVIIRATPDWGNEAASVSLTINADENGENGMGIQNILSVPAISADDLYVSIADWKDTDWDNNKKTKTPLLTIKFPRGRATYEGFSADFGAIMPVLISQNPPVSGEGLNMSPDWEDKTYDITFTFKNGAQYVVEGYKIPAITKDEIFITQIVTSGEQTPDYASGKQDGDYRVFVLQLSAPKDIPADSITTNYGTVTFDATTKRATLSVKEGWTANTVILSIKDTNININTGITVPANTNKNLEEDEILWTAATWDAESPSYEIPFTLVEGAKLDDISLTTNNDAVDATLDADNHKIVLSKHNAEAETWLTQGWKNQIINVKFAKGETELFTKKVLVIPHKSLNVDEDITITDKDQGYPTNNYYISFKITIPNDLEISDFSSSNGTMKKNNDGYKIDGEMSASTTITLTLVLKNTTTKVCTVTKNLYSVGGSVEFMSINSRFTSLTGKLKKLSDKETSVITSETPKTQSISLFNWVTDLFENNEETASNVSAISDATPVKTAKKAVKAAIPAVTETSPFSDVIAESAVAARSITNEPVEKVVETVAAKNAQMVVSAGSIVETETSVITDSIVDSMEEADSTDVKALIWTLIAALSAALITAGAVFYRKRHKA